MNELLMTIVGGLIVAVVSQLLAHYLALKREELKEEDDSNEVKQGS